MMILYIQRGFFIVHFSNSKYSLNGHNFQKKKNNCCIRGVRKYNPSSNVWLTSPFLMGLKVAQTRLVSPDKGMVQHQRRIGSIRITSFEKKSYLFCAIFFQFTVHLCPHIIYLLSSIYS